MLISSTNPPRGNLTNLRWGLGPLALRSGSRGVRVQFRRVQLLTGESPVAVLRSGSEEPGAEAERPPTPPPQHQVKCPSPRPGHLVQPSGPSKFPRVLLEAPGSWCGAVQEGPVAYRRVQVGSSAESGCQRSPVAARRSPFAARGSPVAAQVGWVRSPDRKGPVFRRPCPPPPARPAIPP